jgi:NodT family efflux transporter outer membrane factor (OMF) lipoprotein
MIRVRIAAALAASWLPAACSFAPVYTVPQSAETPAGYRESEGWAAAQPGDELPKGKWWTIFDDSALDAFEDKAHRANQNLKAAFARLEQARADTRIARADLFPAISTTASAKRGRVSPNSPTYTAGAPTEGNDFLLEADLSYEADLWGRVRNSVAAARATQQASAADVAAVDLSIQAEVATDYFGLRSYDTQQELLQKTIEAYGKALDLTQTLFDGGAAALSDVAQAKTQLYNAQTQASDIHLQRAQLEHGIAVLLGENPSVFQIPANPLPQTATPPRVDPGIPSTLLQRRPDVAEAERRVAAANAQIGVARAAYFPQFRLLGSGGYNSVHANNWIDAPSLFWSLGPQVSLPLFEGGRLLAQTARAKAAYSEQVASYRSTVLTAYQDVEDNLVALRQLEMESETEAQAVVAADTALQQSLARYSAGIVTYLEVATIETAALQTQLSAINIRARRLNASVLLVKALGGSWREQTRVASNTPGGQFSSAHSATEQ